MKKEIINNTPYSFIEKDGRKYYWDDKHNHFFTLYEGEWISSKQISSGLFKYLRLFFQSDYKKVSRDCRDMVVRYAKTEIENKIMDIDKQIERIEVQKILDKTCQKVKELQNQQK